LLKCTYKEWLAKKDPLKELGSKKVYWGLDMDEPCSKEDMHDVLLEDFFDQIAEWEDHRLPLVLVAVTPLVIGPQLEEWIDGIYEWLNENYTTDEYDEEEPSEEARTTFSAFTKAVRSTFEATVCKEVARVSFDYDDLFEIAVDNFNLKGKDPSDWNIVESLIKMRTFSEENDLD
jgi:hypothetical protein